MAKLADQSISDAAAIQTGGKRGPKRGGKPLSPSRNETQARHNKLEMEGRNAGLQLYVVRWSFIMYLVIFSKEKRQQAPHGTNDTQVRHRHEMDGRNAGIQQ